MRFLLLEIERYPAAEAVFGLQSCVSKRSVRRVEQAPDLKKSEKQRRVLPVWLDAAANLARRQTFYCYVGHLGPGQ
jgi:hypothetical protein